MNTYTGKIQENKQQSVFNARTQKTFTGVPTFQFVDNRPDTIQMNNFQELATHKAKNTPFQFVDNRSETIAQRKLQKTANNHKLIQFNPKRKNRRTMTSYDREARREARFSSTIAGGTTIFDNNEGRLPNTPRGTHYIETDSGAGRTNRGTRRIVSLVHDSNGAVQRQYLTYDHYRTFQEIR